MAEVSEQLQAAKRKFQKVNQEIVKQNVTLHDQLAKTKQEHHLIMQENIRLKGKIVALESKLVESETALTETKKSIAERMEMLEAIGNHLIDVTKFLRMISATPPEQEMEPFDMPDKTPSSSRYSKATMTSKKLSSNSLRSIKEEEPQESPFMRSWSMRKPVSFFLVEYEKGDLLGYLLAWCCFVPSFIVAIQASVFSTLYLQSRTTVSGRSGKPNRAVKVSGMLLLGQLINEALNLILKNIIRQSRPDSNHGFEDYGMPSSHSQFMAFVAASFPYLAAETIKATDIPYPTLLNTLCSVACYTGSLAVAFARIYLKYHTTEQVLAGLLLGFVLGTIWKYRYLRSASVALKNTRLQH